MIFRLAIRELIHSRRRLGSVLLVLIVGFIGPLFSSALRTSVDAYLKLRSRQILSADIAVSSLRPLTPQEKDSLEKIVHPVSRAEEVEFITMGKGRGVSTLVEVKAVDERFPVFGSFETIQNEILDSAAPLSKEPIAWVFPEVLAQLGLHEGDVIGLGKSEFKIARVIEDGPGLVRGAAFAPRLYIGRAYLETTGLTAFGSQVSHRTYLHLPSGLTIEAASAQIKEALKDPDIFLRTPDDSTAGFERFFSFFNQYLVAISMIVFALSWASAFYILQIFLQERLKSSAILLTFGASRLKTGFVSVLQVFFLMAAALAIAFVLVAGAVQVSPMALGELLPKGFVLFIGGKDFLRLLCVAVASALAFTLPLFVRLFRLKLQDLLGENALGAERLSRAQSILAYGPLAVVFLGLSVWLMGSWENALQVTGGILAAALVGWLVARVAFKLLFASLRHRPGLARLVATNLSRSRFGMNLCFITLLLVALVLNLVPHTLKSAVAEIEPLEGREIPALFLFNIPEEAVESLKSFAQQKGAELRYLSPMILARLMKVNGEPTKVDQFQRFPVRLSYRSERIPSETLVEGKDFSGRYDPASNQPAELSVEKRWAERNGFKLGDQIEFDVQGLPVSGRITSIRSVKWTNFNPNFFILFQPGVLDDVPKTYLANVNIPGEAKARDESKVRIQFELVRDFPDLNVIDIGRTLGRGLEIARSILGPVRAAAWIAVAMSFLILIGVIAHNLRLRDREVDIEKVLGADASLIRQLITSEYTTAASLAVLLGAGSALLLTWVVSVRILDIPFRIDGPALAASIGVVIGITSLIAFVSCARILNLRGTSRKL